MVDAEETVACVAGEGRKFEDARASKGRKEERRGGMRPRNSPLRPKKPAPAMQVKDMEILAN